MFGSLDNAQRRIYVVWQLVRCGTIEASSLECLARLGVCTFVNFSVWYSV